MRTLKENHVLLLSVLESAGAMGISIDDLIARIAQLDRDITRDTLRSNLRQLLEYGFVETVADAPPRVYITTTGKTALKNWRTKR